MSGEFSAHEKAEGRCAGGRILVELDEPVLQAALSLYPAGGGGAFETQPVLDLLSKMGVAEGIDMPAIEKAIGTVRQTGQAVIQVIVAKGRPEEPSRDARMEWPVFKSIRRTTDDPKDPARFCHVRIVNARQGETVAKHVPARQGQAGMTLRGEEIPVEPAVDEVPRPGRNVCKEHDSFAAERDGRLVIEDQFFHIEEEMIFDKGLTIAHGDVTFVGSIKVMGNIEGGVNVRCGKDMEVSESIIGSGVYCLGNLTVGNGVTGSDNTRVEVRGNLQALFVESANLRVWGDCHINDGFVTSELLCSGTLDMTEGKGHFVSGAAYTRNGIKVNGVGIEIGTKARLSVGRDNLAQERAEEIEGELEQQEDQLKKIQELDKKAGPMTKVYQRLTPVKQEEIELLLEQLPRLEQAIERLKEEGATLKKCVAPNYEAQVVVAGEVNADTLIEHPLSTYRVAGVTSGVLFRYSDAKARVEVIAA